MKEQVMHIGDPGLTINMFNLKILIDLNNFVCLVAKDF